MQAATTSGTTRRLRHYACACSGEADGRCCGAGGKKRICLQVSIPLHAPLPGNAYVSMALQMPGAVRTAAAVLCAWVSRLGDGSNILSLTQIILVANDFEFNHYMSTFGSGVGVIIGLGPAAIRCRVRTRPARHARKASINPIDHRVYPNETAEGEESEPPGDSAQWFLRSPPLAVWPSLRDSQAGAMRSHSSTDLSGS